MPWRVVVGITCLMLAIMMTVLPQFVARGLAPVMSKWSFRVYDANGETIVTRWEGTKPSGAETSGWFHIFLFENDPVELGGFLERGQIENRIVLNGRVYGPANGQTGSRSFSDFSEQDLAGLANKLIPILRFDEAPRSLIALLKAGSSTSRSFSNRRLFLSISDEISALLVFLAAVNLGPVVLRRFLKVRVVLRLSSESLGKRGEMVPKEWGISRVPSESSVGLYSKWDLDPRFTPLGGLGSTNAVRSTNQNTRIEFAECAFDARADGAVREDPSELIERLFNEHRGRLAGHIRRLTEHTSPFVVYGGTALFSLAVVVASYYSGFVAVLTISAIALIGMTILTMGHRRECQCVEAVLKAMCPDCSYRMIEEDSDSPHQSVLLIGPRTCSECGVPWPLLPSSIE